MTTSNTTTTTTTTNHTDTIGTTNVTKGTAVPVNTNTINHTTAPEAPQQMRSTQVTAADENNSKLLKGIILGGMIGGALTLLDSATRNQVKGKAVNLKDCSKDMFVQVKENPGEVKDQMVSQFKSAADTLKQAISDAQNLYERVNEDIFGKVNKVMDASNEAMSAASGMKSELADIGSKVKEAGTELTDTVNLDKISSATSDTDTSTDSNTDSNPKSSRTGTAYSSTSNSGSSKKETVSSTK
ncbi:hypothetical protein [Priestia abyssalis]|uniref:hypothetical protein n=1 Tax=Priestia abyssalis TaxID=1221450 RepID=UPI00195A455D|nr:hypothetical protein [Priestia abyssalis]